MRHLAHKPLVLHGKWAYLHILSVDVNVLVVLRSNDKVAIFMPPKQVNLNNFNHM